MLNIQLKEISEKLDKVLEFIEGYTKANCTCEVQTKTARTTIPNVSTREDTFIPDINFYWEKCPIHGKVVLKSK